jgi:hypothetical protein
MDVASTTFVRTKTTLQGRTIRSIRSPDRLTARQLLRAYGKRLEGR